jgi:hypothetical protein
MVCHEVARESSPKTVEVLVDEETYMKLAENLESFLAKLCDASMNSSVHERQQVLRLMVCDVLLDTDSVIIQHTIPGLDPGGRSTCHLWGYRQNPHAASASGRDTIH